MRCAVFVVFCTFLTCTFLSAQPLILSRGVINAASFMAPGLPGGSIARGSLFSIFGLRLGPAQSPGLNFPLSTTLGGVSVKVIQGSTSVDAIPVFVSATQINAIMPSNAPLGRISLRVTNNLSQQGQPSPATVVAASFGIFAINSGGFGPGVMQDFVSPTQLPINSISAPATPGQTIILYGTGLGAIATPDTQPPPSGNLPAQVEIFVGGKLAARQYSGRSSCCAGLDQINFTVPGDAPTGCWVPLQVRVNGSLVSNTVTMAISGDGSPCSDPANALSEPFRSGSRIGAAAFLRADALEDVGLASAGAVTTDSAMLTFQQETASPFGPFHPIFSLPPAGACGAYTAAGDLFDGDSFPGSTNGKFLNAGATFKLAAGASQKNMGRPATHARNFQPLGYTYTGSKVPSSLFLNPGSFTLTGPGGADVGPFTAEFPIPAGLTWTNREQTSGIGRSSGFTVNWSGAPPGRQVIIFGGNVDLPSNATALFVCLAPDGATNFTVPPQVLGNVPLTRNNLLQSKGAVYVGALPLSNPAAFTANGIDVGAILPGAFAGKTVIFQ